MSRTRHWYAVREAKDAPSWMADFLPQPFRTNGTARENSAIMGAIFAAWAEGYNDAVKAYARELDESLRKESVLRDAVVDL